MPTSVGTNILTAVFLLSLSGCYEKALNRKSEEIIKVSKKYASDPLGSVMAKIKPTFEDTFDNTIETAQKARETSENTHNAVKTLTDTIDSVSETKEATQQSIRNGKESIQRGAESVKKRVKNFVRKVPRSNKEANQLAYAETKGVFDWVRTHLISFQQKNEGRFNPRKRHQGRSRK